MIAWLNGHLSFLQLIVGKDHYTTYGKYLLKGSWKDYTNFNMLIYFVKYTNALLFFLNILEDQGVGLTNPKIKFNDLPFINIGSLEFVGFHQNLLSSMEISEFNKCLRFSL